MAKRIIVNVIPEEIRMALCEDGRLLEVAIERTQSDSLVGNIYKGRVENVLPGMQAAFINIGNGVGSEGGCMVHNSQYDFNDRVLSTGASYWVKLTERWLAC